MPTLSVVMIVRNEAAVLADCLRSVRAIADEIVIGDTGSTDDTKAIAQAHGARIIDVPWRDDFAWARNQVLAAATGDWLLHMDADEVLGEPETVRAIVDADGDGADAIEIMLANYCNTPYAWRWRPADPASPYTRGHAGYLAVPLLRLFRNRRGFEYREAVHENITESVHERGGVIGRADVTIHHYGYAAESTQTDKARRYWVLAREKVRQRPDDPKAWHDLAEQGLACGESAEAEDACRRALTLDPHHAGALSTLAMMLLNRGDLDEARERIESLAPRPPHLEMALGAIDEKQGRLELARERLAQVVRENPAMVVARLYLARVLDRLGDAEGAVRELDETLRLAPAWQDAIARRRAIDLRREGEALVAAGDHALALRTLVEAMRQDPEDPLVQNALGVALHALHQIGAARAAFERALKLAPGMAEAEANLRSLEEDVSGLS